MDILYQSDTILVRRVAAKDRSRWVITFDHYSIGAGFDRSGFGEEFFKKNGISAIHLLGRGPDWYQYPDIFEACGVVRAATRRTARRLAYGLSMGGYAALRLANRVRADAVLALSPQYSIDSQIVPWEQRWEIDTARIDFLPKMRGPIRCRCQPVVIFDPVLDGRHIDLIAADVSATMLPIRHGGHPISPFLEEIGLLRPIVLDMVGGTFDAAKVMAQVRERRPRSAIYLCALAERQPPSRVALAARLVRRAAEIQPDGLPGMLTRARIFATAGNHADALRLHEKAVADSNREMQYLISYAEALVASGNAKAAVPIAREVVAIDPDRSNLRHWLAWVLFRAGDRPSAIEEERIALALAPGTPRYSKALRRYESRLLSFIASRPKVKRLLDRSGVMKRRSDPPPPLTPP